MSVVPHRTDAVARARGSGCGTVEVAGIEDYRAFGSSRPCARAFRASTGPEGLIGFDTGLRETWTCPYEAP
jgi:hypothetical protein